METNKFYNQASELKEILNSPEGMPIVFQYLAFREIQTLPNILAYDEQVEQIVQGNLIQRERNLKDEKEFTTSTMGVLMCSNLRMLWYNKGLLWGLGRKDFNFNDNLRVEYKEGFLFGEIKIHSIGTEITEIGSVYNRCARNFTDHVNKKLSSIHKRL